MRPLSGRLKAITHPAIGNHEYQTVDGQGYFQYFGAAAGDPRLGYYSYDVGTWHMIVLNSNCYKLRGCGSGTAQVKWLKSDLATHQNTCLQRQQNMQSLAAPLIKNTVGPGSPGADNPPEPKVTTRSAGHIPGPHCRPPGARRGGGGIPGR